MLVAILTISRKGIEIEGQSPASDALTDAGSVRRFPAFWMRSLISALILALLLSSHAFPQTVVPITSEPDHHLVISNDYVRVFQVEVPPKAETLYHQHDYDYLYVAIGDADVASTRLHEKPVLVKLKDGEVEFSKGPFAHKATNNSERPFRNVTIELLRGVGTPICGIAGGGICGGFAGGAVGAGVAAGMAITARQQRSSGSSIEASFVLQSSKLAIARVEMHGKQDLTFAQIAAGPYLLVPLSDLQLTKSASSRFGIETLSFTTGRPVWIEEQGLDLTNQAESAKFILFSFSPARTQ